MGVVTHTFFAIHSRLKPTDTGRTLSNLTLSYFDFQLISTIMIILHICIQITGFSVTKLLSV